MSAAALKVTTESRPGSRLAVTVTVPAERTKASYEEAITSLSRSINLPGFRKGKVPRTVVIQQLGAVRIKASALETMVDGAWRDAIQQESLEPISQPELSGGFEGLLDAFTPGEDVTITLEADVAPTPKLKSTKGLTASFEPVAYDPAQGGRDAGGLPQTAGHSGARGGSRCRTGRHRGARVQGHLQR